MNKTLHQWWPKLRMGGILAGHDYMHAGQVQSRNKGEMWWVLGGCWVTWMGDVDRWVGAVNGCCGWVVDAVGV
jgi:hypothetical protein